MLKAMEFIARNINDETILNRWLALGIADGDIEYGDLSVGLDNADRLKYYMEDEAFADMMHNFLWCMARAWKSGGLYCDSLVSKDAGGCISTSPTTRRSRARSTRAASPSQ